MPRIRSLPTTVLALALASGTLAAIGPVADLVISNVDVSPDGFERSAVVAGGAVIGSLITGNKVRSCLSFLIMTFAHESLLDRETTSNST